MSFVLEVAEQYSVEALMLKMNLQHLHHLMWRSSSLEETLMLGTIVGRRRGTKRMRRWVGITDSMDMSLGKLHKIVKDREACSAAICVITKCQTWLSNWIIPMRTEGPVKPLALVGVEKDLGGRGGFPFSSASPCIQGKEYKIVNGYQTLFSKKPKNCFLHEWELWLSVCSRFYWVMWKETGVGCVCKNQVTSCWRARHVVNILH